MYIRMISTPPVSEKLLLLLKIILVKEDYIY